MRFTAEEYSELLRRYPKLSPGKKSVKESAFLKEPKTFASNGLAHAVKKGQMVRLKNRFEWQWAFHGGPDMEKEVRFHPVRMWRFDYALPDYKLAIELDGGTYRKEGGAHSGGAAAKRDRQKSNAAVVLGWKLFRFTTDMINAEEIIPIAKFFKELKK